MRRAQRATETAGRAQMRDAIRTFREAIATGNEKIVFAALDVLATDIPGYHDVAIAESLKPLLKSGDAKFVEALFNQMDTYDVHVDGIPWTQRLLRVNRNVLLWAIVAGRANVVELLLARGSLVDEDHIRAAAKADHSDVSTMRNLLRAHNKQYAGSCNVTISAYLMGTDAAHRAAAHRAACRRMKRLVAALQAAAWTADGREAQFRGIPQLVEHMDPFEKRAHLNEDGTDIRDEVWAAVAPKGAARALPDTLRVLRAITQLGIDVTTNAMRKEQDRLQAEPALQSDYADTLAGFTRKRFTALSYPVQTL